MRKMYSDLTLSNASFMATSLLGLVLSLMFIIPESLSWGIAFSLTFMIMFISSLISLERGPVDLTKEYIAREKELEERIKKESEIMKKKREENKNLRETSKRKSKKRAIKKKNKKGQKAKRSHKKRK